MKPKKKIIISVIATAIFGYAITQNEKESAVSDNTSSLSQSNHIEYRNPTPHHLSQGASSIDRIEVLQKNVKGYREQTYWGNEHPIDRKVEDMDDSEFSDFIENEVKSKDIDIYWGAEY
ncbi:hypothetical protein [Draconibacterium orientale]|uniref:hypothetical protein n=1 Tax=Draconibacterium orientale TaxID=1168034 RepID=UPI0029C0DCA8|nr:hypothetical protein [Draconibacterium orientale]